MMSHNRSEALRGRFDAMRQTAVHEFTGAVYTAANFIRERPKIVRLGLAGGALGLALVGAGLTGTEASAGSPPTAPDRTPAGITGFSTPAPSGDRLTYTATPRRPTRTITVVGTRTTTLRPPSRTPTRRATEATRRPTVTATPTPKPTSAEVPTPPPAVLEKYTCTYERGVPVTRDSKGTAVSGVLVLNPSLPYRTDGSGEPDRCSRYRIAFHPDGDPTTPGNQGVIFSDLSPITDEWTQFVVPPTELTGATYYRFFAPEGGLPTLVANSGDGTKIMGVDDKPLKGGNPEGQLVTIGELTGRYGVSFQCTYPCLKGIQAGKLFYLVSENGPASTTGLNNGLE